MNQEKMIENIETSGVTIDINSVNSAYNDFKRKAASGELDGKAFDDNLAELLFLAGYAARKSGPGSSWTFEPGTGKFYIARPIKL